jgi:hypothetical protein
MKKLAILIFSILNLNVFSQLNNKFHLPKDFGTALAFTENSSGIWKATQDTVVNKICAERGHVPAGTMFTTCVYCPPYHIDTDSTTIIVYPACNSSSGTCSRCKNYYSVLGKEYRETIWKKK